MPLIFSAIGLNVEKMCTHSIEAQEYMDIHILSFSGAFGLKLTMFLSLTQNMATP